MERLCRYVTRPAICLERLKVRADSKIQYELKNPFRDGTTHILFSPLDFLSKLAALVPKPRHNLVRYHGVFAPNSKMRQLIVPKRNRPIEKVKKGNDKLEITEEIPNLGELYAPLTWAERLRRVFNIDIATCPLCGGSMRIIADITDQDIIQTTLDHTRGPPRSPHPPRKRSPAIQSKNML